MQMSNLEASIIKITRLAKRRLVSSSAERKCSDRGVINLTWLRSQSASEPIWGAAIHIKAHKDKIAGNYCEEFSSNRLDPIVIAVSLGESHWKILVVIYSIIRSTRIVHSHSKAKISTPEAQNHNCYWMVQICFLKGRIKSDRLPTAGPRRNNKRHRSERSPFIWESCKKWGVFNYKRRIPTRTHA